jgi:tetratricopeptide (TPR) repeat protein
MQIHAQMQHFSSKFISLLLAATLFSTISAAQTSADQVDKNKVAAFFQNEQYTEAIEYLESRKVATSSDLNLLNDLGYSYFKGKNYTLAQQQYGKVLALDSLNFTANNYTASINFIKKDYKNELFYYERLLRIQPEIAGLYKLTGDAYTHLSKTDTAGIFYAKAYNMQPANTKIAAAYVDNLLDQLSYATADSVTNAFLNKDSLNATIIDLSIRSYTSQNKHNRAAALSKHWLLSGEIVPKTSVDLARANYTIKDYNMCFLLCDTLLKQGIETESLLYYASQAKYKLNDFTASNELLKRCLSLAISKNTNVYYFSKADNFEALKQYKKAIAAYDTAFYLFKDPLALYNIGRVYEQGLKNKTSAYQYYKKYLAFAKPASKDEQRVYAYVKEMLAHFKD